MSIAFDDFFEAVWGYRPYPWQSELSRVVREEGWPDVLDIPTGSGKTAVLDIALHHLATEGGRIAPRRVIMVVDRRVIVDQVGGRAVTLLNALHSADQADSPEKRAALTGMRDALHRIVGEGAPILHTEVLRGGVVRRDAWARYPHVPVLAGSTVDQVGSRLFFRGYGLSDRMRPLHAGLLGCDTLLLLDEVHLARPFAEVLAQLQRLREREGGSEIPRRFQVVELSATPGRTIVGASTGNDGAETETSDPQPGVSGAASHPKVFRLADADRENERLSRVLQARKPAALNLVEVKARSAEAMKRRAIAEQVARHAREMVAEGRKAVAVVVNRVDTARRAWGLLQDPRFDAVLITGRMRPFDQETTLSRIQKRVAPDRVRDPDARPLVVVATQTIEAGADYDFDGLVTECASLDALRQRFGRLDRKGEYARRAQDDRSPSAPQLEAFDETETGAGHEAGSGAAITARGVIVMRSDYLGNVVDPVYGDALPQTWQWLMEIGNGEPVDFGIEAIEPHLDAAGDRLTKMLAPHRNEPVLLPAYLDQWAQTSPAPHADPDVSLFLHGIPEDARSVLPDVRVVWRSDLSEQDLATDVPAPELLEHLAMAPPGSLEALSLPVWTVNGWLSGADRDAQDDDIADVEGVAGPTDEGKGATRRVLVWRGKQSESVNANKIVPGTTIVVPEAYGGIGEHGTFDPDAPASLQDATGRGPVYDLGDVVQLRQRGSPTLRLDPDVLRPFVDSQRIAALLPDPEDEELNTATALGNALRSLRGMALPDAPEWFAELLKALGSDLRFVPSPREKRHSWFAFGRRDPATAGAPVATLTRSSPEPTPDTGGDVAIGGSGEEEAESFTGGLTPALLNDHLTGVEQLAERFARQAQLPSETITSLKWAGRLHDVGKADSRFQLWLQGGDEVAVRFGKLLAKSAIPWQSAAARRDARRRARYPDGQRHELVSLDMIERSAELKDRIEAEGGDWELVLHLVAAHHGWCRPLAPVVELADNDGQPVSITLHGLELEGSTAHGRDRLGSGVAARFWRLNRRYGRHELAYLEAILRLADHRQSAEEAER